MNGTNAARPHTANWHPVNWLTGKVNNERVTHYACVECGQTVSVETVRAGRLIDHRPEAASV